MDPLTLAASAFAVLSPYLSTAGTKAAEEIGKKLPEYAGKMWTAIADKFKGKAAAQEAVSELLNKPDDGDNQGAFRQQLRKLLESDPEFANTFEGLLSSAESEAKSQGGDTIIVTGDGAAASGDGVAAGKGGMAIKGDVHGNITLDQSKT